MYHQYDTQWDDLEEIREGDYAFLITEMLFVDNPVFVGAAENGAMFKVGKIQGVMVDLLWQDAQGIELTGQFHVTNVDVVVHGNLSSANPLWSPHESLRRGMNNPAPLLSLRERTCLAFEQEYDAMKARAMETWGHMPISFEEFMDEKLNFEGQRESWEATSDRWAEMVKEANKEVLGLKRELLRQQNLNIARVNRLVKDEAELSGYLTAIYHLLNSAGVTPAMYPQERVQSLIIERDQLRLRLEKHETPLTPEQIAERDAIAVEIMDEIEQEEKHREAQSEEINRLREALDTCLDEAAKILAYPATNFIMSDAAFLNNRANAIKSAAINALNPTRK